MNITELIDKIIKLWDDWGANQEFYVNELAPSLLKNPDNGTKEEASIFQEINNIISQREINEFHKIILNRKQILDEHQKHIAENQLAEKQSREQERENRYNRLVQLELEKKEELRREKARLEQERREQQRLKHIKIEEEKRAREQKEKIQRKYINRLNELVRTDYLTCYDYLRNECEGILSFQEGENRIIHFIQNWLEHETGTRPDKEQARAVSSIKNNFLVAARAGSGKTTTIVNRAYFLIKHCNIPPNTILLLAFNKTAAIEMKKRLLFLFVEKGKKEFTLEYEERKNNRKYNPKISYDDFDNACIDAVSKKHHIHLPYCMTFHALAYSIVHPEENFLYDGSQGQEQSLSKAVQQIIDDFLKDSQFRTSIRRVMLNHFKGTWEKIIEGGYDKSKENLLEYRRSLVSESLSGEFVKSFGEKIIADFLFEHNIPYKYERNHWWGKVNYRPDFTIFKTSAPGVKSGVVIEYFGIAGDPDYDIMSTKKRKYWKSKSHWDLIEFIPSDIRTGGEGLFQKKIKLLLEDKNIPCAKLSEDEIWLKLKDRAIDRFTKTVVSCIGHCRKTLIPPKRLREMMYSFSSAIIEKEYYELVFQIYTAYLARLKATGEEDFDGLIQRASQKVMNGQTDFHRVSEIGNLKYLKYLFIDEYQDFSKLFYNLVKSIKAQNKNVELFCVGDNWQAINGFAGSDLEYFSNYENYIAPSSRIDLSTNYRSKKIIVEAGNDLMEDLGKPAIAKIEDMGLILLADLVSFQPSITEIKRHPGDIITPVTLRLIRNSLKKDLDVVLLARRNTLPWYVNYSDYEGGSYQNNLEQYLKLIQNYFPEKIRHRISISTAHGYKGREKGTVIIMDAVFRSFPLVHPDWVFKKIFGENEKKIIAEEKRLFYVAMTRAKHELVIITEAQSRSPFLSRISQNTEVAEIDWEKYAPIESLEESNRVYIVQIKNSSTNYASQDSGTYPIKDQLKASGYRWNSNDKTWEKTYLAEKFSIEAVKKEVWGNQAMNIQAQVITETQSVCAKYTKDSSQWECLFN